MEKGGGVGGKWGWRRGVNHIVGIWGQKPMNSFSLSKKPKLLCTKRKHDKYVLKMLFYNVHIQMQIQ